MCVYIHIGYVYFRVVLIPGEKLNSKGILVLFVVKTLHNFGFFKNNI